MGKQTQGEVLSLTELPKLVQTEVIKETTNIKVAWSKSVESILAIGKSLQRLKELLPHGTYLTHIRSELGLNEVQSARFVGVYRRFGDAKSTKLLQSKVSVLYLLGSPSADLKKVETLAGGGVVEINGKRKSIDQLNVNDAQKLRPALRLQSKDPTPAEIDKERAATIHRELGTLIEELSDYCHDLQRFQKKRIEIKDVNLIVEYLHECSDSISKTIKTLR